MIGDIPHPFLLIHIPKTAGTSVENALIPVACGGKRLRELNSDELSRHALPGGERKQTASNYQVRGGVVQHECVAYFQDIGKLEGREIVSIVRNPYDRALSEIFYLLRTIPAAEKVFCGPTWADDLKTYAAYDGYLAHDLRACQVDWLMDHNDHLRCDRILRFESLAADWSRLCSDWGIGEITLPRVHDIGRKVPWWEYYDDEAANAIAQKYAKDFAMLGYDTQMPKTDHATKRARTLWLGDVPAPDSSMIVVNQNLRHKRLEIPPESMGCIRIYGNLERRTIDAASELLKKCRDLLVQGGEIILQTLDLQFLSSLVVNAYDEDSVQSQFVRAYVDEFMPEGSCYAPANVLSHLLLHKGFETLYDELLVNEILTSVGLELAWSDHSEIGELKICAKLAQDSD